MEYRRGRLRPCDGSMAIRLPSRSRRQIHRHKYFTKLTCTVVLANLYRLGDELRGIDSALREIVGIGKPWPRTPKRTFRYAGCARDSRSLAARDNSKRRSRPTDGDRNVIREVVYAQGLAWPRPRSVVSAGSLCGYLKIEEEHCSLAFLAVGVPPLTRAPQCDT